MDQPGFADAWALAEPLEGWLTRDQAAVLFDAVRSLAPGCTVVEIGSHQGRSTVVLASALPEGGRVVAVDPFAGLAVRRPGHTCPAGAPSRRAGVGDAGRGRRHHLARGVHGVRRSSVDLVYVDGKHDYWTVREDLRWADRVSTGGAVLVHDAFSSLGVTLALLRTLPVAPRLAYAGRTGSLARLDVRRPGSPTASGRSRELPWWVRNLVVKVLLRLRLRGAARLLGHDLAEDPY